MAFSKRATVTVLAASLGIFTTGAFAQEPATSLNCLKMSKQVKDAMAHQTPGPAVDAAANEHKVGTTYCTKGFYKAGIARYEAALKLMGGSSTASSSGHSSS
ncbi:MAG TPA: hypothetical protein VL026_15460 [Rhizomicrobium sp.]|nr:hypothetical protein [Rhizomicrobium sp.]